MSVPVVWPCSRSTITLFERLIKLTVSMPSPPSSVFPPVPTITRSLPAPVMTRLLPEPVSTRRSLEPAASFTKMTLSPEVSLTVTFPEPIAMISPLPEPMTVRSREPVSV